MCKYLWLRSDNAWFAICSSSLCDSGRRRGQSSVEAWEKYSSLRHTELNHWMLEAVSHDSTWSREVTVASFNAALLCPGEHPVHTLAEALEKQWVDWAGDVGQGRKLKLEARRKEAPGGKGSTLCHIRQKTWWSGWCLLHKRRSATPPYFCFKWGVQASPPAKMAMGAVAVSSDGDL